MGGEETGDAMIPVDVTYKLPFFDDLAGKVAIITGATRGIGRACALKLASLGCNVCIAAKTTESTPQLPGTIYSVAKECEALGAEALGFRVDMRDAESVKDCVKAVIERFGKLDILINNASALWLRRISQTETRKYDLIHSINVRGTFLMTSACLPHMEKNGFGRVITMSPPISSTGFKNKAAYNVSKMGMTMVALGVAEEYSKDDITGNSLWPSTVIESYASINHKIGEPKFWRKAEILADCVVGIICEKGDFSGNQLIDEEYLRSKGFKDEDFVRYPCDPTFEPPHINTDRSMKVDSRIRGKGKALDAKL